MAFGAVRHAECLAALLGEPYGTLILTVSVIGIEAVMIAAVMITGPDNPALARDTMFAVLMIVLNGMVGINSPGLPHLATLRGPTIQWSSTCGCSSVGRASASQAECRRFESDHPLSKRPIQCRYGRFM